MDARGKFNWWTADRTARLVGGVFFLLALTLLLTPATAPYPTHSTTRAGLLSAAFDNIGSVIVLRTLAAVVVGFVCGALAQRLVSASFAIKLGPSGLELADVTQSTNDSLEGLRENARKMQSHIETRIGNLELQLVEQRETLVMLQRTHR